MFRREKKSKYADFSSDDLPPRPPKPDDADFEDMKEIKKIEPDEKFKKTRRVSEEDAGLSPPIFIKIDKYKGIVSQVRKLKSLSLGLRDALDALGEIEKEIANGVIVANRALDEVNEIIRDLDLRFAKVRELEGRRAPKDVEDYVQEGYERVEKLKKNFERVEE